MKRYPGFLLHIFVSIAVFSIVFTGLGMISGCDPAPRAEVARARSRAIKPANEPLARIDLKLGEHDMPFGVWLMEIDGCEYLVTRVHYGVSLAHKGNCKFCREATKVLR